jgi:ATP/maltotriose-dependent transcriptional regulator MalT
VCLPLLFQGIPVGVLYLENSLMAGVFTPDRLEVLKLLSSQMAYVQKLQSFLEHDNISVKDETPLLLIEPLTERELDVLNLIAEGMSNKEIALGLYLTVNTVKTHILNIYGKLQVNRRMQAVTRARELKLLKQV